MVISAWIVFIIIVGFIITNIIIYKKNEAYRNKIKIMIKKKWIIVTLVFLTPILIYTIATSFLIMVQGDCFSGYYCDVHWIGLRPYGNIQVIYYNGQGYSFISVYDENLINKAYEYGAGEWKYTDTYIVGESPVGFPYLEYWCPKLFRGEVIVPGELEPVYIRVTSGGSTTDYIRHDMLEE